MEPTVTTAPKWYDKTWLVVLLCIFFFPVGLYAIWKNSSIAKGWKIAYTIFITVAVLAQIGKDKDSEGNIYVADVSSSNSNSGGEKKAVSPKNVSIGDVLHTDYFDVVVNRVSLEERVNTGNQYASLKAEPGNLYLIMNVTFKNTDSESRMLTDGSIWINYNGKNFEFDKSETVMLEGWGLMLEQINPLTIKTTNLVYKLPAEISGPAYWQPGRAKKSQKIFLGNLE